MASSINSEDSQPIDTTGIDRTPSVKASDSIRALSARKDPVNILVIGTAGLVNQHWSMDWLVGT